MDHPTDDTLRQIAERVAGSGYHAWHGNQLVSVEPGRAVMRIDLQPHHLNPQRIVHGGVIASLLDSVCGISLRTLLQPGMTHRTVQLAVAYLAAARGGSIVGSATAIHRGRRTGYAEGEVRDESGRLLARGSATFLVLPEQT